MHYNVSMNKFIFFIFYVFLQNSFNYSLAKDFSLEVYMHIVDQRKIDFPDGNKYLHIDRSANWKDSLGEYGIIKCLATITTKEQESSATLHAFCKARDQNNDNFWLNLNRTSDMQIGVGVATYIFGTGKYKKYIGLKCPYAVNYFEDRMFYKQKCNT